MTAMKIVDVERLGPFSFRWPEGDEHFEAGWAFRLIEPGVVHRVRHGIGGREVYGRYRVHTVTWVDGEVQVEGVEADDYPSTGALLSVLRRPDRRLVRTLAEVPPEYHGFELVEHRREIDAKWSRNCIAVKIGEQDLNAWGHHAVLRMRLRAQRGAVRSEATRRLETLPAQRPLLAPPSRSDREITAALLAHGTALAASIGGAAARFTPDEAANELVHTEPSAFLLAVICDQGIRRQQLAVHLDRPEAAALLSRAGRTAAVGREALSAR